MTRILLRSRKDPFTIASPEVTHRDNLIANNAGNLVFSQAMHRILTTADTEVTANRFRTDTGDAARINEEYDAFVVPLANAFRPSFRTALAKLTALIERLTIPVVVVGVGVQADVEYSNTGRLAAMEPEVKAFISAVLDRSTSIGVRGEYTESYVRDLGFRDVEVIGCPSMFSRGADLRLDMPSAPLTSDSKIAINVSPYVKRMAAIVRAHYDRYPDLTYVAQDVETLGLMLWGEMAGKVSSDADMPVHIGHPLYRDNKMRFFVDPRTWIDFLSTRDFSFGTRIHGNIVSLLAGTPAVLLAHDSRTLELAKYHEIPYRLIRDLAVDVDAARLYDGADYTGFHDGHRERLARFTGFLERNGVRHALADDSLGQAFDERLRAVAFPAGVETLASTDAETIAARMRWLREQAPPMVRVTVPRQGLAGRASRKLRAIIRG